MVKSPAQASRVRSAFAKRKNFFEAKHVGTFNASAARQRSCVRIELAEAGVAKQLISAKRNSDSENIEFDRTAGS